AAGYYIKIKHNGTYTSGYNHFSRYAKGMYIGAQVKQGQVIGYVGSTGYANGPHLDFRIWKNGQLTDPLKIKAPPVEPIKEENEVAFYKIRNLMTLLLDRI
ncbi:MAG: M23 family metallopeptidase, partial [Bacteroidales bacterium]|nr:M23 family metallopeptidase [Bacteroidales bacterium]